MVSGAVSLGFGEILVLNTANTVTPCNANKNCLITTWFRFETCVLGIACLSPDPFFMSFRRNYLFFYKQTEIINVHTSEGLCEK